MKRHIITTSCAVVAGLSAYPASAQDMPEGLLKILQNEVNVCQNLATGEYSTVEFYGYDGRRLNWGNREIFQTRGINNNINGSDGIESISQNKGSYFIATSISAGQEPAVTVDWVVYNPNARGDHSPMESRSGPAIHCFWVDDTASGEPARDDD